jgi:imidazolonepropionase-like amidohydrolase
MKKIFSFLFLLTALIGVSQVPTPAGPQTKPILITGATVHTGTGQVIENGAVAFENGKLTYVGATASAPADRAKYDVINAQGKHVYPGFIITNSILGLIEIESFRATADNTETGSLNPNVRAQAGYSTDSEITPTYRFNGILLAEITPQGGVISGTSTVMQLDAWNWEDATYAKDAAIHLNWPSRLRGRFDFETFTFVTEPNADYGKTVDELTTFFNDAVGYSKLTPKTVNLKMDAMQGILNGSQSLVLHASTSKEIVEAVKFAQSFGVKRIAVVADSESIKVAGFLKDNSIPVIIPIVHSLPARADEDIDSPYALPARLTKAGVTVVFSHIGEMIARGRNLPFYAGTAVAYGMDKEEALKAITINPAKILGIDKTVGSLELGKDATLFISDGDALDFRSNRVSDTFINGRKTILYNKQQILYDQYSKKYGHQK